MTDTRTWRKTRIMLKHRVHGTKGCVKISGLCSWAGTGSLRNVNKFDLYSQSNGKTSSPPKGISELAVVWRMDLKDQDWNQEDHLGVYNGPPWRSFHEHNEPRMKVSTQSQNICFKVESIKLYYGLTMRSEGEMVVKDDAHSILLENWVVPIR